MNMLFKLIPTLWPFFKEMVLDNRTVRQFLRDNLAVVSHITITAVLFLLFINLYLASISTGYLIAEQKNQIKTYEIRLELNEDRLRLMEKNFEIRLEEKRERILALEKRLEHHKDDPVPPPVNQRNSTIINKPKPVVVYKPKPIKPSKPESDSYLDILKHIDDD